VSKIDIGYIYFLSLMRSETHFQNCVNNPYSAVQSSSEIATQHDWHGVIAYRSYHIINNVNRRYDVSIDPTLNHNNAYVWGLLQRK